MLVLPALLPVVWLCVVPVQPQERQGRPAQVSVRQPVRLELPELLPLALLPPVRLWLALLPMKPALQQPVLRARASAQLHSMQARLEA